MLMTSNKNQTVTGNSLEVNKYYEWEIGLTDGTVIKNKRLGFDPELVNRVTFIPRKAGLPIHNVDIKPGRFVKQFGRGFRKSQYGWALVDYIHCVHTLDWRFWLFPCGNTATTAPATEVYV